MIRRVLSVVVVCLLLGVSGVLAQDKGECEGVRPVGLVVGQEARVAAGTASNNLRDVPSLDGKRLGKVAGGTVVKVLAGPRCVDDLVWWQIDYEGLVGWTVDRIDGQQRLSLAAPETPALSTTVMTPETTDQIDVLRTLACQDGNEYSPLIAWNATYYAQPCHHSSITGTQIEVMDVWSGTTVLAIYADGVSIYPLAFVDDTTLLWIAAEDWYTNNSPELTALHLTNVVTGEEIASAGVEGGHSAFFFPIFFANRTRFALLRPTEPGYAVEVWDALTLEIVETYPLALPAGLTADQHPITYTFSEDGTQSAIFWIDSAHGDGFITLYHLGASESPVRINVTGEFQTLDPELAFSPSGNFLLLAYCETLDPAKAGFFCKGSNIVWFTTKAGEAVTRWKVPFEDIGPMSFNTGGLLVMSAPFNRVLYDVDTGEALRLFDGHSPQGMFNADGTLLLTNGDAGTFIWGIPGPTPEG